MFWQFYYVTVKQNLKTVAEVHFPAKMLGRLASSQPFKISKKLFPRGFSHGVVHVAGIHNTNENALCTILLKKPNTSQQGIR